MKPKVTIIDYGLGNLYSVGRAFEVCGADVRFVSNPVEVASAQLLVLPGVGAFKEGMYRLEKLGLVQALRNYAGTGKPLLGICLGMQLLATTSEEFGTTLGLDIIKGNVLKLPNVDIWHNKICVPNIGWKKIEEPKKNAWENTLFGQINKDLSVYHIHSFSFKPSDETDVLAYSTFGGHKLVSAVKRNHVVGLQFHPEKSGPLGLKIISKFIDN